MAHFLEASSRILNSGTHPVVTAAAIAYPFVFFHPFSDGNGRIHRFLIPLTYDRARKEMREIVDLPNRQADLFIRLCLQNKGHLSKSKRALPEFALLSNEEVQKLETAVVDSFKKISLSLI